MKQIILSAAVALFSVSAMAQGGAANIKTLAIGHNIPAADVKMEAADGKSYSLNDVKTKNGLLVMFSCNTCPYVVKSQQRTREMMKLATYKGVGMVVVNSNEAQRGTEDSYDAMKKYAADQKYFQPYVMDKNSALANAFGATRTPEVFLFDASGKLVYSGAMEDNPSDPANSKSMYLADAINKLNTGTAIAPATTKSIGCSIKRVAKM